MNLPDPEGAARLLDRLRDASGGVWADLFVERRCVLRVAAGDIAGGKAVEAWDSGAGIRVVKGSGRAIHASSTGPPGRAVIAAARNLVGLAGEGAGEAAPDAGGGTDAPGEEADREPLTPWLSRERDLLAGYAGSLQAALCRELSSSSCRTVIDAAASSQEILHISTDSPLVGDTRTGAVVNLTCHGRGAVLRRSWAARTSEELERRWPPAVEVPRLGEALRRMEEAAPAPCGEFPVVFGAGAGGLLVHEAVGHLLEGDVVLRGSSPFSPYLRPGSLEPDALVPLSPLLTVIDSPSDLRGRGSYELDDEGTKVRRTVLVQRGRIIGHLGDRWNSPGTTGHGRRQSHREPPMPRLAATFCAPGEHDPAEIVRETVRGVFVDELRRGFLDPASGDFVLHAAEGRLIEGGKLTAGLRDLVLLGSALKSLSQVDRVGSDLAGDGGAHSCVRGGQAVATIVGMPTLRIASMNVAGMMVP